MNKIAVSAAAITALFASHAMAADMAVKSAPPAPAPAVYNWTGWYVGVNAGASFGSAKTDFNNGTATVTCAAAPCTAIGSTLSVPTFSNSDRLNPRRFHRWRSDRLQLAVFPPHRRRA